jgi:radical SAM protein with 4Fe4S-binding SPASM domain
VVERDKEIMSVESFTTLIKDAKNHAEQICLHLMGEPLAHPKIKEILDVCNKENVKIQLTTNGILLKRYKDLLISSNCLRQINFSLQSYKDNFPHKPLDGYFSPILMFTKDLHESRPEVYINFRLWNLGAESTDNEDIIRVCEQFYDVEINRKTEVTNIKSKRIWNRVYLHFDSRFEWPDLKLDVISKKGRCHGISGHIGIHADGTVTPCCLDKEADIKLGNAFEDNLESILKSTRTTAMLEGFKRGDLVEDLCQKCDYIQRFSK